MAGPEWHSPIALRRMLVKEGGSFEFFRAVQLLERLAPRTAVGVGALGPVSREPVRFKHDPALSFPAGDIAEIRDVAGLRGISKLEIIPDFLGLIGVSSPLPIFETEDYFDAEGGAGGEQSVVYDLIHHRLYSLFYRAWKKYRFSANARSDGTDTFTSRALAFVGVDAQAAPDKGLSAAHLLRLAPLLAMRTRPARALQLLLMDALRVPVAIESFVPRIVTLDEDQHAKLGRANMSLGVDFMVGARVVDRSGRFRTVIGPVSQDILDQLVPGGRHHARLRQVIGQFTRGILEAEVEVQLTDSGRPFKLGEGGVRLGVDTRLPTETPRAMAVRFIMSEDPTKVRPEMVEL